MQRLISNKLRMNKSSASDLAHRASPVSSPLMVAKEAAVSLRTVALHPPQLPLVKPPHTRIRYTTGKSPPCSLPKKGTKIIEKLTNIFRNCCNIWTSQCVGGWSTMGITCPTCVTG